MNLYTTDILCCSTAKEVFEFWREKRDTVGAVFRNLRSVQPISGFPENPSVQKQSGVCSMTTHCALVPQLQGVTQRVLRHASESEHSDVASQPTRMGVARERERESGKIF